MPPAGTLYLIPTALNESGDAGLSPATTAIILGLEHFVVENLRSARRFLRRIGYSKDFQTVQMVVLAGDEAFQPDLLQPLLAAPTVRIGLLSEAGSPAVADPGAAVVRWAHDCGLRVVPLPGPSSIMLALMASGLNGQHFAFHGYLPVHAVQRRQRIRRLEAESRQSGQTQIVMETPYRNNALLADLLASLQPDTRLCVAAALTSADEFICCRSVAKWKTERPDLKGRPALFLFQVPLRTG